MATVHRKESNPISPQTETLISRIFRYLKCGCTCRHEVFKSATVQGLPECVGSKRKLYRVAWGIVLFLSMIACIIHLYLLMATFIESPNGTSIQYYHNPHLELPTIHLLPYLGRFLDAEKIGIELKRNGSKLNAEYVYAMELGLGVVNHHDFSTYSFTLNISKLREEYDKAVAIHGSIVAAARAFYAEYSLNCTQIFRTMCFTGTDRRMNCCDIFEPVFTMLGPSFATKPGKLFTFGTGILNSFRINVLMHKAPRFAMTPIGVLYVPLEQEMKVGLQDGLDQSPRWPDVVYMKTNEFAFFRVRQQRHFWMPKSGRCIEDPSLAYFRNYTTGNCGWQKAFFDQFWKRNLTCQLPLIELMKAGVTATEPCDLDTILDLYDYRFDPVTGRNTIPSMWSAANGLIDGDTDAYCTFPCEHTSHIYSHSKSESRHLPGMMQIQVQFETNEVEVIEETPRQSLSEYIALIGGNFGLWTGASLISIGHFVVLFLRWLGILKTPKTDKVGDQTVAARISSPSQSQRLSSDSVGSVSFVV